MTGMSNRFVVTSASLSADAADVTSGGSGDDQAGEAPGGRGSATPTSAITQVDRGEQVGHGGSERGAGERRRKLSGAVAGHPERGEQDTGVAAFRCADAAGGEYRVQRGRPDRAAEAAEERGGGHRGAQVAAVDIILDRHDEDLADHAEPRVRTRLKRHRCPPATGARRRRRGSSTRGSSRRGRAPENALYRPVA